MEKLKKLLTKQKRGEFTTYMFMFTLVFMFMIFSMSLLKKNVALITVKKAEDSLKATTLAGATADLEKYGSSGELVFIDYEDSYNNFKDSFKNSMELGDDFAPTDVNSPISTPIHIDAYILYNVIDGNIECITYTNNGSTPNITHGTVGTIYTPNGIKVTHSTVYSAISFDIQGYINNASMLGKVIHMDDIPVKKTCCIDITGDETN